MSFPLPASGSVAIRYVDAPAIIVRGPVSGEEYVFSRLRPVHRVDSRDAEGLLRLRFFRLAD